jgi:hypothetical protein
MFRKPLDPATTSKTIRDMFVSYGMPVNEATIVATELVYCHSKINRLQTASYWHSAMIAILVIDVILLLIRPYLGML